MLSKGLFDILFRDPIELILLKGAFEKLLFCFYSTENSRIFKETCFKRTSFKLYTHGYVPYIGAGRHVSHINRSVHV